MKEKMKRIEEYTKAMRELLDRLKTQIQRMKSMMKYGELMLQA